MKKSISCDTCNHNPRNHNKKIWVDCKKPGCLDPVDKKLIMSYPGFKEPEYNFAYKNWEPYYSETLDDKLFEI